MTTDLALARAVLATPVVPDPVAVRAAALLARRALEHLVADVLRLRLPGAERGTLRAQLLCLRSLDPIAGPEAAQLHGELSDACHHHPYELGPTVDEARELITRTARVHHRLRGEAADDQLAPSSR